MDIVKNICVYLVIGFVANGICHWLQSGYLQTFLHNQIITLSITLVAINSAVRGVVLGKISDLSSTFKELNFDSTFKELKISLYEQIVMIFLSIALLILYHSKRFNIEDIQSAKFIIDSLLISILTYNIYILLDTGKSIIEIFVAIVNSKNQGN